MGLALGAFREYAARAAAAEEARRRAEQVARERSAQLRITSANLPLQEFLDLIVEEMVAFAGVEGGVDPILGRVRPRRLVTDFVCETRFVEIEELAGEGIVTGPANLRRRIACEQRPAATRLSGDTARSSVPGTLRRIDQRPQAFEPVSGH